MDRGMHGRDSYGGFIFEGSFLFNYPNLLVKFDLHMQSYVVCIENEIWAGTRGNHRAVSQQGLCPGVSGTDYSEVAVTHSQAASNWDDAVISMTNSLVHHNGTFKIFKLRDA